ncbi:MAG: hypothetical protein JWP37_832 [Mucilaginibacter sp.]|nr:hypothetical protein [Mucilaginibacter sp.]
MWPYRNFLIIFFLLICLKAHSQQDVDLHLNAHLLTGKKVLKVKRDYHDPFLWALTSGNGVYRINSITLQVDDYSSKFIAYNNLQFNDIAGRSADTVFIATNSTNVIEYKTGTLRLIGPQDGLSGTINEVGMDHLLEAQLKQNGGLAGLPVLMIATTANVYYYDCVNEVVTMLVMPPANNHLYETTYRNEVYSNVGFLYGYDPSKQLNVVNRTAITIYGGDLWYNMPEFGNHIYTAYYTPGSYYSYDTGYNMVLFMDQLWGTENGLFENNWNSSYFFTSGYRHYLTGIKVNKITSIYGLINFGSENPKGLTKENLLVATDEGFYFSDSGYLKYVADNIRDYNTFTLDQEIGKQVINDICVNATSYSPTICEDAIWVAATDGLYCLKPDFGKYINSQLLQAAAFQGMKSDVSSVKICAGTTTTAVINDNLYTGTTLQWYKDGKEMPGESKNSLVINAAGDYYTVLYDPCSILHFETNHLQVQLISAPAFSFNYPDKIQQCDNTPLTLQTDNEPAYQYRWYTNGVLNGNTTPAYTVTQTGKYKVEVSACTNSWVSSKEVEVDLVTLPVPAVTTDKVKYCAGETASLTTNVPPAPDYKISWYKDGNVITEDQDKTAISATTGGSYSVTISSLIANCTQTSVLQQIAFTPAPSFTFNYPDELRYCTGTPVILKSEGSSTYQYRWYKDGALTGDVTASLNIVQNGKYKVEVSGCEGSWIPSKEVQVDLINLPVPIITADKASYCIGDNATLSAGLPADPNYTINWYKDNELLSANSNQTLLNTNAGGSYMVTITNDLANSDGTTCTQKSASQAILFNQLPTVSIQKIVKTTLCDGQSVDLKVSHDGSTVKWSTGETADQISVSTPGNYKATVTSLAGCTAVANVDVTFYSNPILNIPDAGVCVPSHKTATLTAPAGLTTYTWNGQKGSQTYTADHPQTVTLTVTDVNNCQATQEIQVTDECPEIRIPNTFTPNGDGINDTWVIAGLSYDQTCLVQVFTRYGQQVLESRGYATSWNGNYKGKRMASGVYYYIITAKNGTLKYSGSVTIIY